MNRDNEELHGGFDFSELKRLGLKPDEVIDFSSNILPYGPSPLVVEAVTRAKFDRYPDREGTSTRETIASHYSISPSQVVLGNGCSELIHLVARAFHGTDRSHAIASPTFSEYRRACQLLSARYSEPIGFEPPAFEFALSHWEEDWDKSQANVIWLCNPNNPTGGYIQRGPLIELIDRSPDRMFVVDESYIDFVEGAESLVTEARDNLIVLRSMTKAYAIAGLRLGFAVSTEKNCQAIAKYRIPWSVNELAMAAGSAAVHDQVYYDRCLTTLRNHSKSMQAQTRELELETVGSTTNFFLVRVSNADACRNSLLQHGMLVRSCTSFGLPQYIRISVQEEASNRRLIEVLRTTGWHASFR